VCTRRTGRARMLDPLTHAAVRSPAGYVS
jgi:hypothetical protein